MKVSIGIVGPALFLLASVLAYEGESPEEASSSAETVKIEGESLRRQDLPEEIPVQIFESGFAVIRVRIHNGGSDVVELRPEDFQVVDPRGKKLEQAALTEITPHLVKFYVPGGAGVHGEIGNWPKYPTVAHWERGEHGVAGPGSIDVGAAPAVRGALEQHQVQATVLGPGDSLEGLLYVKSKNSGAKLKGGKIIWQGREVSLE
jgi:hypothetical protein